MDGKQLIKTLRIQNLLSYGDAMPEFTLEPLNVFIGANASGKSNLLEALRLLAATPGDLTVPIRDGGGIGEWLWKGTENIPTAEIETTIDYPDGVPLRYRLAFTRAGQYLELTDEAVENAHPCAGDDDTFFYYRYQQGQPMLNTRSQIAETTLVLKEPEWVKRSLKREELQSNQSILAQRKDPDLYPALTYLASQFHGIRLYGDWCIGDNTRLRQPQPADLPEDFLLENCRNLGLVLNEIDQHPQVKRALLVSLRKFYEAAEDLTVKVTGGTVQVFLHERGLKQPIPATRLSDGTLRFICLLTIFCHPSPPPVVCIEEPEIGLHPDILPAIAELLVEASTRMQLFITTHSAALVSALSETPEAVVVCERDDTGTQLRRLDPEKLAKWLERYSLGDLWGMGELGGNRW